MSFAPGTSARIAESAAATNETFVLCAVQFPIRERRTVQALLASMEDDITSAARAGAGLVLFPELLAWDLYDSSSDRSAADQFARIAREDWPVFAAGVARLSARHQVAVAAGTFLREMEGRVVNTALLQFQSGERHLQDKLMLTPEERSLGWLPGSTLNVFEAPWGRTALLVCYDSQSPLLSHLLCPFEPVLILVPSMTGESGCDRVRAAARGLAVTHHCYVAVTGSVDRSGRAVPDLMGQAAVLAPIDVGFAPIVAEGTRGVPGMIRAEISFDQLRKSRARADVIWAGRDQRRLPAVSVVS